MILLCKIGFHDWVTEYFGAGYPMRECRRCGRCEVKPIGCMTWHRAGEGVTLDFTRKHHALIREGEISSFEFRTRQITFEEYTKKTNELIQKISNLNAEIKTPTQYFKGEVLRLESFPRPLSSEEIAEKYMKERKELMEAEE